MNLEQLAKEIADRAYCRGDSTKQEWYESTKQSVIQVLGSWHKDLMSKLPKNYDFGSKDWEEAWETCHDAFTEVLRLEETMGGYPISDTKENPSKEKPEPKWWCDHVVWKENFTFSPIGKGKTGYWFITSPGPGRMIQEYMYETMDVCPHAGCGTPRPSEKVDKEEAKDCQCFCHTGGFAGNINSHECCKPESKVPVPERLDEKWFGDPMYEKINEIISKLHDLERRVGK